MYIITPIDHKSQLLPYSSPNNISGAIVDGVPLIDYSISLLCTLAKPKSQILGTIYPLGYLSIKIFANFKSL